MKRLLIVLLFLVLPFFNSTPIFAQSVTPTDTATTTPVTAEETLWDKIWNWITGIFIKTDYNIAQRPSEEIKSDMTNYGNTTDTDKHSSSGTRLTDSKSQKCYKGNVIKKVAKGEYSDSDLSYICPDSSDSNKCTVKTLNSSDVSGCQKISIKNLSIYFVQINQKFYCDDQNNFLPIESDVLNAVNTFISNGSLPEIPSNNLSCYQNIYNDFYLVPKNSVQNEENTKKIVQTPISDNEQKSDNTNDMKDQLDKTLSPAGSSAGLKGLRPASW